MPPNPSLHDRLARIRKKLRRGRWRGLTCFGSEKHKFRLARPATIDAVEAFERDHGAKLPEDYRAFLTELGAHGAGPYYGILPLEQWDTAYLYGAASGALSRPFRLRADEPRPQGEWAWAKALGLEVESAFEGIVTIVDQGCGHYGVLVVTGPERGRIAYVDSDGNPPYFVEHPDFLSWYERWLDELLWGYRIFWFGCGMPGTEQDFLTALGDTGRPAERRAAAARAMARLPKASEASIQALLRCLDDPNPGVRESAVGSLAEHARERSAGALCRALDDPDREVQMAALRAVSALKGQAWHAGARRMLSANDPQLSLKAIDALAQAKALSDAELIR